MPGVGADPLGGLGSADSVVPGQSSSLVACKARAGRCFPPRCLCAAPWCCGLVVNLRPAV